MEQLIQRYRLEIEYDGTNYHGFQKQNNLNIPTIENSLLKAINNIFNQDPIITVSGRTDAGVHALLQTINFDLNKNYFPYQIISGLNHYFRTNNHNISIIKCQKVNDDFNARLDAKMRHYRYIIINRNSPLTIDKYRAWHITKQLNVQDMIQASKILIGTHDFSSFRDADCQANSPIRTINKIFIDKIDSKILIEVSAKSFLHHMVRNIVGTLVYVGTGRYQVDFIKDILSAKNRNRSGPNAPACGLYFLKTDY
ncbi:tRNA pseudouridine synthase A [Alphaproteobacteria bacterium]|nr:tRNA pseudouridine synthase A [Alphaproteobacteria bacterium]